MFRWSYKWEDNIKTDCQDLRIETICLKGDSLAHSFKQDNNQGLCLAGMLCCLAWLKGFDLSKQSIAVILTVDEP